MKAKLPNLKCEPDFQDLKLSFRYEDYKRLEEDILENGSCDPVCVWDQYIVDGHKRYEICHKHGIKFSF